MQKQPDTTAPQNEDSDEIFLFLRTILIIKKLLEAKFSLF